MAENHYQADADYGREVAVVADPQSVSERAVAEERADVEALPTDARLVRSFLSWKVGHRLVRPAEEDRRPGVKTRRELDEDENSDDKEGDGANKPGDRCGEFEGVSSGCDHAGDEHRGR